MGKDREGKFHPRKGKPSGALREGSGIHSIDTSAIEDQLEIAEKYTDEDEMPASNVHMRHPNRNVDKRDVRSRTKTSGIPGSSQGGSDTAAEELPARPSKEQFAELANFKGEHCMTIYLPTSQSSSVETNKQKDYIGFKNKLQQLSSTLKERNIPSDSIEKLLKPGHDLLRNEDLWRGMSKGLAVYIAEGFFKYIRLPAAPKEDMIVNSSFYLTPLIPVMTITDHFYVLVLSKKQAKLYRGDYYGMQFVPVEGMPRGVDDVVHFEEKDDEDLFRTESTGAGEGANYHGIGTGRPDPKTNLAMYFDEVDEILWKEVLHSERAPLLLAGVEYLIPIYKQVAKYKPIWDDAITGNHEHEDIGALYEQARARMEPYFNERVTKALESYGNQSATELTSSIPGDIIPAAHYGRVATLFAARGEHIWGSFDEMQNQLTVNDSQGDKDECLVDKTVIRTIMNGGEVFLLSPEQVPGGNKLAAIMRY